MGVLTRPLTVEQAKKRRAINGKVRVVLRVDLDTLVNYDADSLHYYFQKRILESGTLVHERYNVTGHCPAEDTENGTFNGEILIEVIGDFIDE
jgi:hypothetical protein